jgi:hypothetical protein
MLDTQRRFQPHRHRPLAMRQPVYAAAQIAPVSEARISIEVAAELMAAEVRGPPREHKPSCGRA